MPEHSPTGMTSKPGERIRHQDFVKGESRSATGLRAAKPSHPAGFGAVMAA